MGRIPSIPQLSRWIAVTSALALLPAWVSAQESVTITGRVTGTLGEPLRDANVGIFELGIGVWTAPDGSYRLIVPGGRAQGQLAKLTARLIGYRLQSVPITLTPGATLTQSFQLTSDPLRLDEIVVTGAGTEQQAERLGTARATVDAPELQRANEPNVVQALAGKIPNVLTNQGSGDAGASTAIQIRGAKTFGTSQPVIIVDGVPTNNATRGQAVLSGAPSPNRAADINAEDIESIEILKGAAATSIYGASAGSAGAILITTKRGRAGLTQYTLRSTLQFDQPVRTLPVQRLYGVGSNGISSNCFTLNCTVSSNFFSWGPALAPGTQTYDHGAEMFETGHLMDNTLSMSGGNERTTFYLSLGQVNQDGFIVGSQDKYERYTARFSGSHSLFENLTINANVSVVQTKGTGLDRGNSINGIGIGALRQPPDFNAQQYLSNGVHRSWRFPNPGPTAFTNNRGFDNPFYALNEDLLLGQTGRYFGNISVNWRPINWLQFNWTLGGDYNADDRTYAYAQASSGTAGGALERWQFYDRLFDHNLTATGSHEFNPNVRGSLTLGQNLNETYFRQVDVFASTWLAPTPFKLSNTVSRTLPNDAETRRRVEGYFGQANVDLYDQLFLQARLRNDANSAFGVGHQRAWYPGGSVAWSFGKAVRLPEQYVTFGKLRVAYGESGQQPPLYATQDVFTTAAFADFNPGSLQGTTINGIGGLYASTTRGNPDISPERVKELEAGVDLSLFRGRADLSVTRYVSKSEDVVFGVNLSPSTGFTNININSGALSNKGWELTTNVRVLQKSDWSIEIGANWARNRNLVTSLGATQSQLDGLVPMPTVENCGPEAKVPRCQIGIGSSFSGQSTHAQIGYPLGTWRANDFARCGRGLTIVNTFDVGAACAGAPDGALYIAPNGFPITDPNVRALGNPWPDWTAGISGTVSFKGFQLTAFLDHRHGGNVLNMTRSSMDQYGTHKDTEGRGEDRTFGKNMICYNLTCDVLNGPVVGPGAGIAVPIGEGWFSGGPLGSGQGATGGPITTRLEDATFTRLREISITYSFKGRWVNKVAGLHALDVKLSGRNLRLWTRYSGYDPEVNLGGAQNANRGIDWFNAPLARAWVVQVTLHH
ncbi:MAG TPA: SusC/RagA family TonB-linked outer membrane protein [Gemmatimonadales bacterium]|nr:SusC/RagA family TonB-linked outer membrane protein [Gemmatimonadales bacterium]